MKKTSKRSKSKLTKVKDLKMREKGTKKVKGGLLTNPSFRVNTLTFSSNATGIG